MRDFLRMVARLHQPYVHFSGDMFKQSISSHFPATRLINMFNVFLVESKPMSMQLFIVK